MGRQGSNLLAAEDLERMDMKPGIFLEALAPEVGTADIENCDCGCGSIHAGMDGGAYIFLGHGPLGSGKDNRPGGGFMKEKDAMWYVMQVASGKEGNTVLLVERILPGRILERCFVPMRRIKKKYQGSWREVTEKLFPGYVFLASEEPQLLYDELKRIPALTKLLGSCEEYFTPLAEPDVQLLAKLQVARTAGDGQESAKDKQKTRGMGDVEISKVAIGEGKQARILAGPLKNLEGQIRKINLHKRIAVVEAEFMGNRTLIHLGIEIVDEGL